MAPVSSGKVVSIFDRLHESASEPQQPCVMSIVAKLKRLSPATLEVVEAAVDKIIARRGPRMADIASVRSVEYNVAATFDADGRIVELHSDRPDLMMWSTPSTIGQAPENMFLPTMAKAMRRGLEQAKATGETVSVEFDIVLSNEVRQARGKILPPGPGGRQMGYCVATIIPLSPSFVQ